MKQKNKKELKYEQSRRVKKHFEASLWFVMLVCLKTRDLNVLLQSLDNVEPVKLIFVFALLFLVSTTTALHNSLNNPYLSYAQLISSEN